MGILLSQKDNTILAEYLIRGLLPGMELSEFELYPELPAEMSDFLPAPEDIARKING